MVLLALFFFRADLDICGFLMLLLVILFVCLLGLDLRLNSHKTNTLPLNYSSSPICGSLRIIEISLLEACHWDLHKVHGFLDSLGYIDILMFQVFPP